MFKNLKEKIIFILMAFLGFGLMWVLSRFSLATPFALLIIGGTLYYAHKRLKGGLPSPWRVMKERWFQESFEDGDESASGDGESNQKKPRQS